MLLDVSKSSSSFLIALSHSAKVQVVAHKMWSRFKSKEKTIGVSVSWNFNSSRKDYYAERNIYNEDYDKGTFEVK